MNNFHYPSYIKNLILLIPVGIAIFFSCSSSRQSNTSEFPTFLDSKEFENYLNKSVSIYGFASNAKMGALIDLSDSSVVWIDGMQNWPTKYYSKSIKINGVLTKEEFYPIVIEDADSLLYHAGVTVLKSEFDGKPLYKYVLKDADY